MTAPHTFMPDGMGDCEHCPLPEAHKSHVAPSLPYAGTSGHSGTDTSRERAEHRDGEGLTGAMQTTLANLVLDRGREGVTIEEVRQGFPNDHHGTLSGTLSVLHKEGRIAMLTGKRGRCHIYVSPLYVEGRETVAHGTRRSRLTAEDKALLTDAERRIETPLRGAEEARILQGLVDLVVRLNGGSS